MKGKGRKAKDDIRDDRFACKECNYTTDFPNLARGHKARTGHEIEVQGGADTLTWVLDSNYVRAAPSL